MESADGFAQVFPEHKYRIVELLQKKGHIVGMTGDGVNDAPALKKADAGVAVAGATDAAKAAADVVLTKPGLSVIIDAIKEARKIFARMNNYAIYRIAETMRVLFFLSLAIIIFSFYPLTPVMIVVLALLNDLPIMMIAYDNVRIADKPVRWNMREVIMVASLLGIYRGICKFPTLHYSYLCASLKRRCSHDAYVPEDGCCWSHDDLPCANPGAAFLEAPISGDYSFSSSGRHTGTCQHLWRLIGVLMYPIGWALAGFIWGYALLEFVITDFLKIRYFRLVEKRGLE